MGPKTKKLISILEELIILLESDHEDHWSKWMKDCKSRLLRSDYSGITKLLGAYGGMGSFNDLIIAQNSTSEEFSWKSNYQELNNRLDELRSEASSVANYIKRNHEEKP